LSGGQQQRVAIARSIVTEPTILLADEPTGALDQKTEAAIMELFEEINHEGRTVVMITHDKNIASHAHRIIYTLLMENLPSSLSKKGAFFNDF